MPSHPSEQLNNILCWHWKHYHPLHYKGVELQDHIKQCTPSGRLSDFTHLHKPAVHYRDVHTVLSKLLYLLCMKEAQYNHGWSACMRAILQGKITRGIRDCSPLCGHKSLTLMYGAHIQTMHWVDHVTWTIARYRHAHQNSRVVMYLEKDKKKIPLILVIGSEPLGPYNSSTLLLEDQSCLNPEKAIDTGLLLWTTPVNRKQP